MTQWERPTVNQAVESARAKLRRMLAAGFELSRNDRKIVFLGQLLTTLESPGDVAHVLIRSDVELSEIAVSKQKTQAFLFD